MLRPAAVRDLEALPAAARTRLAPHIEALAGNPRPRGVVKLAGSDFYRLRVGNYRVVYEVRDQVLVILMIRVGHRREVYRRP